jgi:hypothetical protein
MRFFALLALLLALPAAAAPITVAGQPGAPFTTPSNSYRWLDSQQRDLTGLRLSACNIQVERNAVRIDKGQSDIVIRDCVFRLKAPTTGSNLPVAIEVINGSNVLLENVIARDFRMKPINGIYPNGDCFSGEKLAHDITLREILANNCSDGGFDFKSTDLRFENATADTVGLAFRIWGQATASTITCANWSKGCIQGNTGGSFVVDRLILKPAPGDVTNFGVSKGYTLDIKACEGALAAGTVLYFQEGASKSNTNVTLCGVKVTNQTDAQLRAQITARIAADGAARAAVTEDITGLCAFVTPLADNDNNGKIDLGAANRKLCGNAPRVQYKGRNRAGQYVYEAAA